MSAPLVSEDVLFYQRLLRAEGLYLAALDGEWGPKTEAAVKAFDAQSVTVRDATHSFDHRSERCICSLSLRAQRLAREFLSRVLDGGVHARIISGTRTYAEQDQLFRKGRFGNTSPRVTNARGGQSNHNFGIAWDVGIFTASGGYLNDGPGYLETAQLGLSGAEDEIEWGGHWTGFIDRPHYQMRLDSLNVEQLRLNFESGQLDLTRLV